MKKINTEVDFYSKCAPYIQMGFTADMPANETWVFEKVVVPKQPAKRDLVDNSDDAQEITGFIPDSSLEEAAAPTISFKKITNPKDSQGR